jgi:hypothetical protein
MYTIKTNDLGTVNVDKEVATKHCRSGGHGPVMAW